MDVILSHFSAAELRVKCVTAVQDDLGHAQTQLHLALDALKRSLSVVPASRNMVKIPLVLVDESPQVQTALEQIVAACNEMGTLICDLSRELSSTGTMDTSDDDEDTNKKTERKRSPETEKVAVERKKSCKRYREKYEEEKAVVKEEIAQSGAKTSVKKETMKNSEKEAVETEEIGRPIAPGSPTRGEIVASVPAELVEPPPTLMEDEQKEPESKQLPIQKTKKRKASRTNGLVVAKRVARDVVDQLRKRSEMSPSGAVGVAVCSALNAAIALEEHEDTTTKGPLMKTFASATAEAGRVLVDVHTSHPAQAEWHLEDMRLVMSVAVKHFERGLSREEVRVAWQMLGEIQKLHDIYPAKTKILNRRWLQIRKNLVKEYEVPADVVGDLKTQLLKLLVELRGWKPLHKLPLKPFDQNMSFINELLDSRYEMWDPRREPILGRLVGTMERMCTFGEGDACYASICRACSHMSRSTFVWTFDLADDITDRLLRSDVLESGLKMKAGWRTT